MFETQEGLFKKTAHYISNLSENELHEYLKDYLHKSGQNLLDVVSDSEFLNYLWGQIENKILESKGENEHV